MDRQLCNATAHYSPTVGFMAFGGFEERKKKKKIMAGYVVMLRVHQVGAGLHNSDVKLMVCKLTLPVYMQFLY